MLTPSRLRAQYVSLLQEERFLFACKAYIEEGQPGELPPTPERTFERHWELRCEPDWQLAFSMFAAGLPLFLANVGLLAWVKFHYSALTAGFITAVAALAVTVWLRMHLKVRARALCAPHPRACTRSACVQPPDMRAAAVTRRGSTSSGARCCASPPRRCIRRQAACARRTSSVGYRGTGAPTSTPPRARAWAIDRRRATRGTPARRGSE